MFGGVAIIILLIAGFFLINKPKQTPREQLPPPPVLPSTRTYATSTFSVTYPDGYMADDTYKYEGVPKKPIPGVKFTIPGTMATGTNLSADTGVSVESLPRALKCTGDIYVYENVKTADLIVGSTTYSVASTSGAGAGNLYEERVFAFKDHKPCIAVRYFTHSTQVANYPAGTVREFDRAALLADFDKIRDSIQFK